MITRKWFSINAKFVLLHAKSCGLRKWLSDTSVKLSPRSLLFTLLIYQVYLLFFTAHNFSLKNFKTAEHSILSLKFSLGRKREVNNAPTSWRSWPGSIGNFISISNLPPPPRLPRPWRGWRGWGRCVMKGPAQEAGGEERSFLFDCNWSLYLGPRHLQVLQGQPSLIKTKAILSWPPRICQA